MRTVCCCLLILWLSALTGCLLPGSSLTDGSVPIGDLDGGLYEPSRATGSTALQPVADAEVELLSPDGELFMSTRTDAAGNFSFQKLPRGQLIVRAVKEADEQALADISIETREHIEVVLTYAPCVTNIAGILLDPSSPMGYIGEDIRFTARVVTTQQSPVDIPVCWVVKGNIGTIAPDGCFHPTRSGSGQVIAQYGRFKSIAPVTVLRPDSSP